MSETTTTTATAQPIVAAPESAVIKLGQTVHTIRPLTLGQLKVVLPAFAKSRLGGIAAMEAATEVIHAALSREISGLTLADVDGMEMTTLQMTAAVHTIATLAGLVPAGEAPAGTGEATNP